MVYEAVRSWFPGRRSTGPRPLVRGAQARRALVRCVEQAFIAALADQSPQRAWTAGSPSDEFVSRLARIVAIPALVGAIDLEAPERPAFLQLLDAVHRSLATLSTLDVLEFGESQAESFGLDPQQLTDRFFRRLVVAITASPDLGELARALLDGTPGLPLDELPDGPTATGNEDPTDLRGRAASASAGDATQGPFERAAPDPAVVPTLPPWFVAGRSEETRLLAAVADADPGDLLAVTARRMGVGSGGTSLATWLTHHPATTDRFPQVRWLTVGSRPDATVLLAQLARAVSGREPPTVDEDHLWSFCAQRLDGRPTLVVVDGVDDGAVVAPLTRDGWPAVTLAVTSSAVPLPGGATQIDLGPLDDELAAAIVAAHFEAGDVEVDPPTQAALVERGGGHPLLLRLLSRAVVGRSQMRRVDPARAASWVLDRHGQLADAAAGGVGAATWPTRRLLVGAAVEVLLHQAARNRPRLAADPGAALRVLAGLPDRTSVPVEIVGRLWESLAVAAADQVTGLIDRFAADGVLDGRVWRERGRVLVPPAVSAAVRGVDPEVVGRTSERLLDLLLPVDAADAATSTYLWEQLGWHLHALGRDAELEALLAEPGYVLGRIAASGVAGLDHDLRSVELERVTKALSDVVRRNAACFVAVDGPSQLAPTLASRLQGSDEAETLRVRIEARATGMHLRPREPLPDLPQVTLTGEPNGVGHCDVVVARTPDVSHVALAAAGDLAEAMIRLYRLAGDAVVEHAGLEHASPDRRQPVMALTPDGRSVAVGAQDGWLRARAWAGSDDVTVASGHVGPLEVMAWSPDGAVLATGGWDGVVRLRSGVVGSTRPPSPPAAHVGPVGQLAWSADGAHLLSAGALDGRVRVWRRHDDELRPLAGSSDDAPGAGTGDHADDVEPPAHVGLFDAFVWSRDGTLRPPLAADVPVRLWGRDGRELLVGLPGVRGLVAAAAWSPDGALIATGGGRDGRVHVWDVAHRVTVGTLPGHDGAVAVLAWSPDGRHLVTAGRDDVEVRVWTLREVPPTLVSTTRRRRPGADPVCLEVAASGRLVGHHDPVVAAAWSPDGARVVTTGVDGTVRVWDVASGTERTRLGTLTCWPVVVWPGPATIVLAGDAGVTLLDLVSL